MSLHELWKPQPVPAAMQNSAQSWFAKTGLNLVVAALRHVRKLPQAQRPMTLKEDDITVLVQRAMQWEIKEQKLATVMAVFQRPVVTGVNVLAGSATKESKKLDLVIERGDPMGDLYLTIEAKVLVNKPYASWKRSRLVKEYVIEGMNRFVSGAYGRGMRLGVMVGYVRNGGGHRPLVSRIKKAISKQGLACTQPLRLRNLKRRRMKAHYRSLHPRGTETFALHHLFISV